MRTDLRVPFAEKDEAKRLGARWDPARKLWYVQNVPNLAAFERWLPASAMTPTATSAVRTETAPAKGGARYFDLSCDCVPWEGCSRCSAICESRSWRHGRTPRTT